MSDRAWVGVPGLSDGSPVSSLRSLTSQPRTHPLPSRKEQGGPCRSSCPPCQRGQHFPEMSTKAIGHNSVCEHPSSPGGQAALGRAGELGTVLPGESWGCEEAEGNGGGGGGHECPVVSSLRSLRCRPFSAA